MTTLDSILAEEHVRRQVAFLKIDTDGHELQTLRGAANWMLHGICTGAEVDAALKRMAVKVDAQNDGDPWYQPMAGHEASSLAYQAARALVVEGIGQPNGYTEPLLHRVRRRVKGS